MIYQRTPEWHAARLGKATASRIKDIVARTKTGYSTSRQNYAAELITERITGRPVLGYISPAMQWGTDNEALARAVYAETFGTEVQEAEFVDHPELLWAGASPDGYVGDDGLVETKCPLTSTHLDTLLGAPISGEYLIQMQWQMACTGRAWCDFTSFDPRLPPSMQLHVRRVERSLTAILELEFEVSIFLDEVAARVAQLIERYGLPAAEELADA